MLWNLLFVPIGETLFIWWQLLQRALPLKSAHPARAEALMALVERIRDELAIPILLVSHDRAEVERLAGRVVTLS